MPQRPEDLEAVHALFARERELKERLADLQQELADLRYGAQPEAVRRSRSRGRSMLQVAYVAAKALGGSPASAVRVRALVKTRLHRERAKNSAPK